MYTDILRSSLNLSLSLSLGLKLSLSLSLSLGLSLSLSLSLGLSSSLSLSLSTVNQDRDLRNNVLIKAVQLYLDEKKIEYRNANLQLMRCATQGSHPGLAALR